MPLPAIVPPLIAAGGAILSGVSSAVGAKRANEANIREAEKARGFNAAEAEKNRAFQERMANSSYQRAVADMRLSGINPMLAYSQGGASAPGGSSASGPAASPQRDEISPAVSSALAATRLKQDLALMDEQIRKTRNENTLLYTQQRKIAEEANHLEYMSPYLKRRYQNLSDVEGGFAGKAGAYGTAIGNIFQGVPLGLLKR